VHTNIKVRPRQQTGSDNGTSDESREQLLTSTGEIASSVAEYLVLTSAVKDKGSKGSLNLGLVDGPFVPHIGNSSFLLLRTPQQPARETSISEGRKLKKFCQHHVIYRRCWGLLHTPKLGHGADYFTYSPKEGMMRIFI
jgi:hypothetical protein